MYNFNFKISDLALSYNDSLNIYQFYTEIFAFLSPCVQDIYIFMYLYLENIDKQIKEIIPKVIIPRDKPGLMFGCFILIIFLVWHIFGLSVSLVSHSMHRYPMHEELYIII